MILHEHFNAPSENNEELKYSTRKMKRPNNAKLRSDELAALAVVPSRDIISSYQAHVNEWCPLVAGLGDDISHFMRRQRKLDYLCYRD
jgi:hypothetical protein